MRTLLNGIKKSIPDSVVRAAERLYARIPFAIRYGAVYRDTLRLLLESQHWSKERIDAYQLEEVRRLVAHAYETVPYYGRLYRDAGVSPDDISSLDDIRHLPTIDKDVLRHHREELKSDAFPSSAFQYHTTGGSTARPVGLYWEAARTVPMEKAFMVRQFSWVGFDFRRDRVANIRGIPPKEGRNWEVYAGKELRMSSYVMTPAVMDEYVDAIRRFSPTALIAYPSTALIFANHLIERSVSLPSLRVVLCGSEQVFDWQRRVIERGFGIPMHTWYGQSEYVSFASECRASGEYEFHPEYGLTEFLRPDGTAAAPGEQGEIVATSFLNRAFPLIRYRMEDIATRSSRPESACGHPYLRASRIDGRIQEMIVGKSGNLVSMTAINMHDDTFDSLRQFQFFQETEGEVVLRLTPTERYNEGEREKIRRAIESKLGKEFVLILDEKTPIEQTERGKTRFLDQRLELDRIWRTSPESDRE